MAISLKKGESGVILGKDQIKAGLSKILVELGWDNPKYDGVEDFDLDASAFLLLGNDRAMRDSDLVFYGAKSHPSGSVYSMGDDRGDKDEGNNEQIIVDLSSVPENYKKIAFTVTIDKAEERQPPQNFGQVSNAYIRIVDEANNNEIMRYDLVEDFSVETAVLVGELFREGAEWKFSAIGKGFKDGFAALCKNFGIDVK